MPKNVFNPEFSFDLSGEPAKSDQDAQIAHKIKLRRENYLKTKRSDDDESELSDAENQEITSKEDTVRVKSQSAKKLAKQNSDFFEELNKAELNSDLSSFEQMNISKPLIKALNQMGMTKPTDIQSAAIPTALMGKDICACAVTGSGKTLGFMLPTLERLLYKPKFPQVTRVLVLTPTRELAAQICKVTRDLSQFTSINTVLCAGGFDIKSQEASLRLGPDICIATPGRLIDHLHNTPCFNLETVEILILDEADRMLDECFAQQLKEVMRLCSKTHQTMLFSATMTDTVEELVRLSLKRPVRIFLNQNVDVTPLLKQEFVRLRDSSERSRETILAALVQRKFNDKCIVFVRTKSDCHRICLLLNLLDIQAGELHGSLSQTQRLEKLNEFKEDKINVLVATDLASRGLDIANVRTVINFSMPMTFKHYIHRVGRTARAKNSGRSISLVAEADRWLVKEIVKSSKEPVKCRVIPSDVVQFYRQKIDEARVKLEERLNEEKGEKMMEQMEKDLQRARSKIGGECAKANGAPKRSWLKGVDYKNGGLISENKKLKKSKVKEKKKEVVGDSDSDFDVDNDTTDYIDDKAEQKRGAKRNKTNDNILSKNFRKKIRKF